MTLEETPEFQKALNEACEKQYRVLFYGEQVEKAHSNHLISNTIEDMRRQRKEIEAKFEDIKRRGDQVRYEAMIMANPHMREITANLKRKQPSSGLICPVCGDGDHGNRVNGKPYCFMKAKHEGLGRILLMTPEKAKDWKTPTKRFKQREPWELGENDIVKVK